jgi:hypothetical protein
MRAISLSSLWSLFFIAVQAAQAADIAPDPRPPGEPLAGLAVAGVVLTAAFISLGLWLRKRRQAGTDRLPPVGLSQSPAEESLVGNQKF